MQQEGEHMRAFGYLDEQYSTPSPSEQIRLTGDALSDTVGYSIDHWLFGNSSKDQVLDNLILSMRSGYILALYDSRNLSKAHIEALRERGCRIFSFLPSPKIIELSHFRR